MFRRALCVGAALLASATTRADTGQVVSLRVTTLDGKPFDLARHRGKWVVVNWWATWCVPCIKELPEISAFVSAHRDKVVAIGLAFEDGDRADIVAFLQRRPVGYAVAQVDPNDPPGNLRSPPGLPNTHVISPDGHVAKEFLGPITARDLAAVIEARP